MELKHINDILQEKVLSIFNAAREEALTDFTNFVDIVPQKARLRLSLNIGFNEIIDPKGLCKDVSDLGRWGNGDVEVGISVMGELNDVMDLIQQAFDTQLETAK